MARGLKPRRASCHASVSEYSRAAGPPSKENHLPRVAVPLPWQRRAYYFKNRTAEVLVDDLFQEHRALLQVKNAPTKQLLDRCLDLMSANVTSDNVAQMIAASQPDILAFWNHVLPWFSSSGCQQDLEILSGYLNVLIYEANRPYLHWYGTSEPLALSPSVRATVEWVGWKYRIGKETDSYLEEASSQNQSVV